MDNNISVQAFATKRNGQAELLVDYLIELTLNQLKDKGVIVGFVEPDLHKPFKSDAISDIFDHFFKATLPNGKEYQFWGQTTCYKGNDTSAPEPNKTYEIRETLIEGLGLRANLLEQKADFRTLHFTLGPTSYTYSWFPAAKDNAYDLSLYLPPKIGNEDLFGFISELLEGVSTELEVRQRFHQAQDKNHEFQAFATEAISPLVEWFKSGIPDQPMANQQAELLINEHRAKETMFGEVIRASKKGGENIKGRSLSLLRGESESTDPVLSKTLEDLLKGNPFLSNAIEALDNWDGWIEAHVPIDNKDLRVYLNHLWSLPLPERLVVRRLLIRLNTGEAVRYPSDLQIAGITEHNLYNGNHNEEQVSAIVEKIAQRYSSLGIVNSTKLLEVLRSTGVRLLKQSLKLESYNGTSLKPSFLYVENSLSSHFEVIDFKDSGLPPPIAYYSQFGEFNVNPYSNLKVIVSKTNNKPLAILKAKYFRKQEFPRRSKEESYVGLTTKYKIENDKFVEKYNLPIIMFVDMDKELMPPEYSVIRMFTSGWEVFFSIDTLIKYLQGFEK